MRDRVLEIDDIQGNVLGGFNTDIQELVPLTVAHAPDLQRAAAWVATLSPAVTTVAQVRAQREAMKSSPASVGPWLCVGIGQRLLGKTQSDVLIRDEAFNGGMVKRAPSVLGDKSDPAGWRVGGTGAPVGVLLIVASNDGGATASRAQELVTSAVAAGLSVGHRDTLRRLDDREHFGFRDGISQPQVAGLDDVGELQPGNFVFGYPKVAGSEPFWPVVDPRGLTDNGSLLVFRRLAQDVGAFRAFCASEAMRLAAQWPGLSAGHLGALIVGRWPSGTPVATGQTQDPGQLPPNNDFDFKGDPDGVSCPLGAHIRKINPRNGPKDVLEVPRMLRRGVPFGPLYDAAPEADRGLAFIAFQSSVKSQFEFLTQHWMNSDLNPGRGNDLLVGRSDGSARTMKIRGPAGPIQISAPLADWIKPTGGAYLFVPGKSGLAKFGTPPAALGLWKAHQLWAITLDSVKQSLFERETI
ncbi:Dyp-type peroxidase [Bradyrhizobium sp. 166]|uniref:Dyp-type peroxidase n=1 Tax=Bradyrhizobium sp. 166 TaxID=2782638 RepID=UPI001FF74903|nr:Dyp-type peroxidase [Bradyrhizobium sp. 166]MCK1604762.1 Dyp-type peroxidase [Bradyrhizobium sp. 166]